MAKTKAMCFLLFLVANATMFAQNESPLFERIESSIKRNHSEWKFERRQLANGGKSVRYKWSSDGSLVYVSVFLLSSTQEASQEFKALPTVLEADGIKLKIVHATVPGLGDQNYLWEGSEKERRFGVDFRKGNVVVHTDAASVSVAELFALQIADAIPASVSRR